MRRISAWPALGVGLLLVVTGVGVGLNSASQAATVVASVASGNWSNPAIWNTGTVPAATDKVVIASGHSVTYNVTSSQVSGVSVTSGATLSFNPNASATLKTDANVVVDGTLVMHPASASVQQLLQFVNVNEAAFVGQTMTPDMVTDTDVGLWVTGAGQLDLVGTAKTGWTRVSGSVAAGATSVVASPAPSGWAVGDTVAIAPTGATTTGASSSTGFDESTLSSVSGGTLGLATATARAHPQVNSTWNAEIMDLTRNVRVEGTATGRAHIMVMSTRPQKVDYVGIRYMGPRNNHLGFLSRYALHFHFMGESSRGTEVVGSVVRDSGNHAYVAHASHGVTFRDDVAYNITDHAYWWNDTPNADAPKTNDVVYDHDIAAKVVSDGTQYRLSGFNLLAGNRNTVKDSVAVGVQGAKTSSGFQWPEAHAAEGYSPWSFSQGNVAHNNLHDGIFVWQNSAGPHVIGNFVAYYNADYGIEHGAYVNDYHYEGGQLYGNALAQINSAAVGGNHFDNMIMDGAGVSPYIVESNDHNADGTNRPHIVLSGDTFKNATKAIIGFTPPGHTFPTAIDLQYYTVTNIPADTYFSATAAAGDVVREQPTNAGATQVTATGSAPIPLFAVTADGSSPSASIVTPIAGSQVSGAVTVTPQLYDAYGVTKVELYVDGALTNTSTTGPAFTTTWTAPGTTGAHELWVRAYDASGLSIDSNVVMVGTGCDAMTCPAPVSDTLPPVALIIEPHSGQTDSGTGIVFAVMGSDLGGGTIHHVDFYIDGVKKGSTTTGPNYRLLGGWNTTTYANGLHTLYAVAVDGAGNSLRTPPTVVTVAN